MRRRRLHLPTRWNSLSHIRLFLNTTAGRERHAQEIWFFLFTYFLLSFGLVLLFVAAATLAVTVPRWPHRKTLHRGMSNGRIFVYSKPWEIPIFEFNGRFLISYATWFALYGKTLLIENFSDGPPQPLGCAFN